MSNSNLTSRSPTQSPWNVSRYLSNDSNSTSGDQDHSQDHSPDTSMSSISTSSESSPSSSLNTSPLMTASSIQSTPSTTPTPTPRPRPHRPILNPLKLPRSASASPKTSPFPSPLRARARSCVPSGSNSAVRSGSATPILTAQAQAATVAASATPATPNSISSAWKFVLPQDASVVGGVSISRLNRESSLTDLHPFHHVLEQMKNPHYKPPVSNANTDMNSDRDDRSMDGFEGQQQDTPTSSAPSSARLQSHEHQD